MDYHNENFGGPYLRSAFFCERILQEFDGAISAIRMVNWISARIDDDSKSTESASTLIDLTLFVSFVNGSARGQRSLTVVMESPTEGVAAQRFAFTMVFDGGEDDVAATFWPVEMEVTETGIYWFAVYLDDRLVTRVPLRVAAPESAVSWGLE